ncbi:redoxin family protein [Bremerella sp. JC817]|uniref:TlpA family protein disulfide reductase n=1 Tax=Bremerella sp. JC817 TaxID=3231756 RepID=UPI003459F5EC
MKTTRILIAFLLLALGSTPALRAEEPATATGESRVLAVDALNRFKADPKDTEAFIEFCNKNSEKINALIEKSPQEAKQRLAAVRETLDNLDVSSDPTATMTVRMMHGIFENLDLKLAVQGKTLDQVRQAVVENPNDPQTAQEFTYLLSRNLPQDLSEQVEKNEQWLKDESQFAKQAEEKSDDDVAKIYSQISRRFDDMLQRLERQRKFDAMVGKDMHPFEVDAWLNGEPIDLASMKGKVVLLDFWAIWCHPCIKALPHLNELQQKYGDKGLQVIGVTTYYDFHWPEDAEHPEKGEGEVEPAIEQNAMARLIKENNLVYPTAMVAEPRELYDFYLVSGIPHMVLIDQTGKIQLLKVGATEANYEILNQKIEELLAQPAN